MILKGNERGHAAELAVHLLNPRDNDHVTAHSIEGFIANDLQGALAESAAISQATQCSKRRLGLDGWEDAGPLIDLKEEKCEPLGWLMPWSRNGWKPDGKAEGEDKARFTRARSRGCTRKEVRLLAFRLCLWLMECEKTWLHAQYRSRQEKYFSERVTL